LRFGAWVTSSCGRLALVSVYAFEPDRRVAVVVGPAPVGSLARVVTTQAIILSLAVTSVAASLSQRW